jgi:HK97 family phage portal protein
MQVNPDTALALTTYQACLTLIAESVAQLPCELYRRQGDQRERATDHPVYQLVHHQPNACQTAFEYLEQQQIANGLRGNSYAFIERDRAGRPTALLPLDTDKVQVLKGSDNLPYYRLNGGSPLPKRMIHHVRWFTLNGYTGVSRCNYTATPSAWPWPPRTTPARSLPTAPPWPVCWNDPPWLGSRTQATHR